MWAMEHCRDNVIVSHLNLHLRYYAQFAYKRNHKLLHIDSVREGLMNSMPFSAICDIYVSPCVV